MIAYAASAIRQIDDLHQHFEDRERLEANLALEAALNDAERKIQGNSAAWLAAPRPYPRLSAPGRAWVKAGRYWVAFTTTSPPVIIAVFYDAADIPSRL